MLVKMRAALKHAGFKLSYTFQEIGKHFKIHKKARVAYLKGFWKLISLYSVIN